MKKAQFMAAALACALFCAIGAACGADDRNPNGADDSTTGTIERTVTAEQWTEIAKMQFSNATVTCMGTEFGTQDEIANAEFTQWQCVKYDTPNGLCEMKWEDMWACTSQENGVSYGFQYNPMSEEWYRFVDEGGNLYHDIDFASEIKIGLFEDYTFDEETQMYVSEIEADAGSNSTFVKRAVQFENGKIVQFNSEVRSAKGYEALKISFTDYGTTVVTLPTQWTDMAI